MGAAVMSRAAKHTCSGVGWEGWKPARIREAISASAASEGMRMAERRRWGRIVLRAARCGEDRWTEEVSSLMCVQEGVVGTRWALSAEVWGAMGHYAGRR